MQNFPLPVSPPPPAERRGARLGGGGDAPNGGRQLFAGVPTAAGTPAKNAKIVSVGHLLVPGKAGFSSIRRKPHAYSAVG